jgi:hypothetical protein
MQSALDAFAGSFSDQPVPAKPLNAQNKLSAFIQTAPGCVSYKP